MFDYHTHGNEGMRVPGSLKEFGPGASDKDVRNHAGYKHPSYVIGKNSIYRINPDLTVETFDRWKP